MMANSVQAGALQEMKQLLIAPGQRADVLVQAGGPTRTSSHVRFRDYRGLAAAASR